jgi:uncharacterized membrane protein YcaP (DUF421 family)
MEILGFDIVEALTPDVPIIETVIRGVLMYLVVLVLLRYLQRGKTSPSMPDLLVLVLIADAAQNAMSAEYNSIANGAVLVATIVGTSFILDWLAFRFERVRKFVHPDPRPLIEDGKLIQRELASQLISRSELDTQLRLQGVQDPSEVKAAYLEGTGEMSVIKAEKGEESGRHQGPTAAG